MVGRIGKMNFLLGRPNFSYVSFRAGRVPHDAFLVQGELEAFLKKLSADCEKQFTQLLKALKWQDCSLLGLLSSFSFVAVVVLVVVAVVVVVVAVVAVAVVVVAVVVVAE